MEGALRRLGNALRIGWLIGRQSVTSLRENWGIGLLSVVLAISLWVYVTNRQDPQQTGPVPGAVPVDCVNVPPDKAEAPPCSDQSVTVRVRAPKSVFDHLVADSCRATADVSGVSGNDVQVPVRVACSQARVQVVDWSPAQIRVRLENVTSRTVAVRAHRVGEPPRGFAVRGVTLTPTEVVVTGPESLVSKVATVDADLDLTAASSDVQQTLLLKARDGQGGDIRGVNVEPNDAAVQVKIAQLQFSAVFVVEPEISGTPAAGFSASGVQVDPPFVHISASVEVFQSLDPLHGVATDPVSIDGASTDVVRTVALRLPQGATAAQPVVTVRVTITRSRATSGTALP